MASLVERDGRWRALVRKRGMTRCATFGTKSAAKAWAAKVEAEIDELRASGVMQARGMTLADLIDRYIEELYPAKPWGRSKSADLARIKVDLGHLPASGITSAHLTNYFSTRAKKGSGPVVISAQAGYIVGVLRVAKTLWQLDVPLQAAQDARTALATVGMIGKAKRRDRRVTDAELRKVIAHFKDADSEVPMRDILQFLLATAMRISEVCRLAWDDLDRTAKTIRIRDRKHPNDKIGNDQVVPLLDANGYDAFTIVKRQPKKGPRIFPVNSRTVSKYFSDAVAELDLNDLRLHDLRHEGISRLFEAGYTIEQVALVSGHRDWAMLKRYTHVRATDLHRPSKLKKKAKR